jgi:hypothetical protein
MNMKRMRGRNHRPNGGGGGGGGGYSRNQQNGIPLNRNHVFDSSGPEMRVRGTAQQLYEKYQQLARDAAGNGDRVLGEAYYQHAEHYFRIISAINQAQGQPPQQNGQDRGNYQPQQNGAQNHERQEYQRRDYQNEPQEAPAEPRQEFQPRRFEQRQFEPRPKPEFQRQERNQEQRFRPEPVPDPRIDISSALEAELAAATAGLGEQPEVAAPVIQAAPEPRAIPIIPDAPPPPEQAPAKVARPRGRPRVVKQEVE